MRLLASGMPSNKVGAQLGVSGTTVLKWYRQGGFIPRRPSREPDYLPIGDEYEARKAACREKHLAEKRAQPWTHSVSHDYGRHYKRSRYRGGLVIEPE